MDFLACKHYTCLSCKLANSTALHTGSTWPQSFGGDLNMLQHTAAVCYTLYTLLQLHAAPGVYFLYRTVLCVIGM